MSKLSFGYSSRAEETLKSWVPKLRELVARLIVLEQDRFEEEEIRTTKQFLGQPVYRKVVDVGALPNATTKTVSHGLDVSRIVSIGGIATNGSSYINLPHVNTAAVGNGVNLNINGADVSLTTGINFSSYKGFVFIEYTRD